MTTTAPRERRSRATAQAVVPARPGNFAELTGDYRLKAMDILGFSGVQGIGEIVALVHTGIDVDRLGNVAVRYGLGDNLVRHWLDVSPSTLRRRRKSGRFNEIESDRLVRVSGLYKFAEDVLGTPELASDWMATPNPGLGGKAPTEFAQTETGAREVEDLLGRIAHGVFS